MHGSLGTHELRIGDLEIDLTAHHFQVLKNEFGQVNTDARLRLRGRVDAQRISGDVTIQQGALKADAIMDRVLFRPYATTETPLDES